jgi:hypothetical protein
MALNHRCGFTLVSMRIRIQYFISMQIRSQRFEKQILLNFTAEKILIFYIKNCNILASKTDIRATGKASMQPSKENIQNFRTLLFFIFFIFGCVTVAHMNPDPDPADKNQCGSRSTIKSKCTCRQQLKYSFNISSGHGSGGVRWAFNNGSG